MMNPTSIGVNNKSPSRPAFLRLLFRLLDQYDVRYCVLHSYEGLPEELPTDLDLAVHPDDASKLPYVFQNLQAKSFRPAQCVHYAVNGYCFDFVWFEGLSMNSVSVDITYEYRHGGLILSPGEELVAGRQKQGDFWVPDPRVEFAYLLAKKTLKGNVPTRQEIRLKLLAQELGRSEAEKVAGKFFGKSLKTKIVEACSGGCANEVLDKLKKNLYWTTVARDPTNPIRFHLANAVRLTRRWLKPTGLFVVVLGPDGVGKSTLIQHLSHVLLPPFRRFRIFHWRPMVVFPKNSTGPVTDPHRKPPRCVLSSVVRLLAVLMDYWLGYWLVIRPLLARSGLVIFDRSFHDVLIDSKRYRYGGPRWLVRLFSHSIPESNLFFLLLDAQEEIILSRKQEVPRKELQRQRKALRQLGDELPNTAFVDNMQDMDHTIADASRAVIEHLARRFQCRHASWLASEGHPASEQRSRTEPGDQG